LSTCRKSEKQPKSAWSQHGSRSAEKVEGTPPLYSLLSPPFPLEVGPLNPARDLGERCKLPQQGLGEPQPKLNWVHFSLKIWHLVSTIVIIFVGINWLNLTNIAPIIQWIPCALVQKCLPRKCSGDKTQGVPSNSKSKGDMPLSTHGSVSPIDGCVNN